MVKYWTQEDLLKLKQYIEQGLTSREIGTIFNRLPNAITGKASILGLKFHSRKKFFHDNNFWQTPNLLNSYYAGFTSCDGSLFSRSDETKTCELTFHLSSRDTNWLEIFKESCKFTGSIKNGVKHMNGKIFPYIKLYISDDNSWKYDLKQNFNIVPQKTYILQPPNLTDDLLISSFIAGCIDGDGNIFIDKNRKGFCINWVSSSFDFLDWIRKFADKHCSERISCAKPLSKVIKVNPKFGNYYRYCIGNIRALQLFNLLKDLPIPKLTRKWEQPAVLTLLEEKKLQYPHFFHKSLLPLELAA